MLRSQNIQQGMILVLLSLFRASIVGTDVAYRFAHPGTLSEALREAGFSLVEEESPTLPWIWHGTPEEFWEYRRNQGAQFLHIIGRLAPDVVIAEVLDSIRQYSNVTQVNFTAQIVLASAVRRPVAGVVARLT